MRGNSAVYQPWEDREAPLDPYEHAETLRCLFEKKRHDKDGPVFITYEGEAYPW